MTGLLEIREKLKLIYSKNEFFIVPMIKFLLAFVSLTALNGKMGYMNKLDSLPIVLIAALLCSFLPTGCIIVFAALFSLLHMYALSMEVALVGLCLYLVMFLLFFRFSPRDSIVVLLTPMLFGLKIPYVIPIAMGLLGTPASAVAVGCGVVVYYFLNHVMANANAISTMEDGDAIAKLRLVIDGLIDNKAMVVFILAFAVTIIVVYLIRRMSTDYAWTIAMISGAIINLVLLLVGDLMYDTNMSVTGAILGTVVAILIAKIIEFFRFCVDYSRTEKVQFEDDEYYYYVKAVPKMTVAAQDRTVKTISSQRRSSASRSGAGRSSEGRSGAGRSSEGRSGHGSSHTVSRRENAASGYSRSVVTERTSVNRSGSTTRRPNGQQQVAINSRAVEDMEIEDLGLEDDFGPWE